MDDQIYQRLNNLERQFRCLCNIGSNSLNLSYKVYTALLNQTGTQPPVPTILENTLGDIVWSRSSTGLYEATLMNAFTVNKTISFTGTDLIGGSLIITYNSVSVITFNAWIGGDDSLINTYVEIRVYP